eukprot:3941046-Rhodomonas_salina.4
MLYDLCRDHTCQPSLFQNPKGEGSVLILSVPYVRDGDSVPILRVPEGESFQGRDIIIPVHMSNRYSLRGSDFTGKLKKKWVESPVDDAHFVQIFEGEDEFGGVKACARAVEHLVAGSSIHALSTRKREHTRGLYW